MSAVKLKPNAEHVLETSNLWMRKIRPDDLHHYLRLLRDPQVMRYIGVEQGKLPSTGEVNSIVHGAVNAWEARGYGRWSVFEKETKAFVGFSGFRCEEGVPELISVVHEAYWGNGYAYEAGKACIDYGFEELGFTRICAYSRPANTKARGLLDRLNFKFVAIEEFHGVQGAHYIYEPE